ncbi:polysaccharide deacetylase family protein [Tissierella sp. Yu-01]|uniref:polysaccharide deacetylase family protein n=1 Tax=Tissierella sp. Yu-01 TaxID=3035694 RepID=UPI00240E28AE|nr:polysaccharide deacetylase family protein [Tissierella sp. Yu-01]WFA08433.1 polysaccharide deacetylase family protein [Tissierella sp. Yu-01]
MKGLDDMMNRRIVGVLFGTLILCVLCNILCSKTINTLSDELDGISYDDIESIIEYGEHMAIGAHYPVFENSNINAEILNLINDKVYEFKEGFQGMGILDSNFKSELNIDYEIYRPTDEILSVKFTIMENMYFYAKPKLYVETINYDISRETNIKLEDILKGKYMEKLKSLALRYANYQSSYDFTNFIIQNDKFEFYFEDTHKPLVIPYSALKDNLKSGFLDLESLETFLVENIDLNEVEIVSSETENKDDEVNDNSTITKVISLDKPMIALTFDDGPYTRATIPILDTLKEHNVVATFFVLGNRVPKYQDIVRRMVMEGHEIGNHTYSHMQLTSLSKANIKDQLDRTQKAVFEVAGIEPKIMRPTYGSHDNKIREVINMPMILWSIDPQDWKVKDPEKIANHILSRAKNGDIILLHDIFESTAGAVEIIVPELLNRGFQLVTVSELYEYNGEILSVGNIYNKVYK